MRTVMITGDHPGTALAIARETRVVEDDDTSVLTGAELDELSDEELVRAARTSGSTRASFHATRSASLTRCAAAARWWR